jgi:hypothetical protein
MGARGSGKDPKEGQGDPDGSSPPKGGGHEGSPKEQGNPADGKK